MNNDQITYQHGQIEALIGDISRASTQLESTLADLKSSLTPLVSSWTGSAATEYQVLQDKWNRSSAALQEMLTRVATAASTGNQDMRAADSSAARAWG